MRAANTQPSFDFLTGADSTAPQQSMRESRRQSVRVVPDEVKDARNDELKAEVEKLKYALSSVEQDKEVTKLRHERELRDAQRKAEEDFKKMQTAEGERLKAVRLYEGLVKEMGEFRDAADNQKAALERKGRELEEAKRIVEEEVDDMRAEMEGSVRSLERKVGDLEAMKSSMQRTMEEIKQDLEAKDQALQTTQQELIEKEKTIGNLESEVLRLKAQSGDADTLGVIKRELSEQVAHIRTLEATNREQAAELKHFRQLHKSVEVIEEEKRVLQRKVDQMEDLQQELGEARLQRQRLEDERLAWTAYLQSQADANGELEFDSPEALARALVQERIETATLLERLGGLEPALSEKDSIIQSLEDEKTKLAEELEKAKTSGGGDSKLRIRLEKQRALAVREVEFLRAQLKAFDTEDSTFQPENFDEPKAKRIQELEDMVDQYRAELKSASEELTSMQTSAPGGPQVGSKRGRDDSEDHERLGELIRKNRKLQDEVSSLHQSSALLQKELAVAQERLDVATTSSKTRILSLRDNPTARVEAIKLKTLTTLRAENAALLSQLQKSSMELETVPLSSLEAKELEMEELQEKIKDREKQMDRLKKVWLSKTQEFREAIKNLLGWEVEFLPNGKMKVRSLFYPAVGEEENSIVFDGEKGMFTLAHVPLFQ
jgi:mitotic spindle assembly checkpoint protein MAD1